MNDFDFLIGSWNVVNRALKGAAFVGGDDWDVYPASATGHRLFEGGANLDEIVFPTKGTRGLTLRLFNTETKLWSLYWSSSQTGLLYPPVEGSFDGNRGDFYGDDTHDGKDVRVRFVWSGISATTARWEQAFSLDGGESWLTNWSMEFTRPVSGTPAG